MEEATELQSEENKVSMEKNKKRRLKTPAQLLALENFYNDHKYPTEEMKSELADELELTEKQISGWFCHRRLKDKKLLNDEVCANGRQDRSSGAIQDRGSGLVQDSCGSTKHGDYRYLDPKEVESHGLYNHEFSAADMTYRHRNHHYTENDSATDNTSSENSSSLQERLLPQGQDPYDMETSRHLTPNRTLPPLNPKGANNMGYKPSGYLKVKGEIEHAAITSVKKQLGKHYREDGPLLSVEFDTIPPEAFECQIADLANEAYYVANPALPNSPDVSAVKRQSSLSRYDSYFTKLSSQDSHMEGGDFGSLHDCDFQDKKPRQHINQRPTFHSLTNPLPRKNSSQDLYVDSVGEASAYNSTKNHRMGTKHGFEGMRSDSASNPSDHYEENNNLAVKKTDSLLHGCDNSNLKNVQRSEYVKSKPSNSIHKSQIYLDTEERRLNKKMAKEEKFNGDRKVKKQYHDPDGVSVLSNERMAAKRAKVDPLEEYDVKQTPVVELEPRKSQRSAVEIPSSFSEDETAETSSSVD
ncbi:Homeobox protein NANOG [Spatholobus suberectus]|nr:Homeobox protein NANOG [Spatholobus suberectus]